MSEDQQIGGAIFLGFVIGMTVIVYSFGIWQERKGFDRRDREMKERQRRFFLRFRK